MEQLCNKCRKRPLINATECEVCCKKRRHRQNEKSRRDRLIKSGLCSVCGKQSLTNATECEACQEKRKERDRAEYKDRRESGELLYHQVRAKLFESKNLCNRCGKYSPIIGKKSCNECIEHQNKNSRKYKKIVFDHYGNVCNCCGETVAQFLTLDHIDNDGAEHRRVLGRKGSGRGLYLWIINNNFPNNLQILCMNCNWGKRMNNGICPHKI